MFDEVGYNRAVMLSIIFFLSFFGIIYVYLIYPVVMYVLPVFLPQTELERYKTGDALPTITLVCVLHNEEDVIPEKLENISNLRYPKEKLEFHFVSDFSDDDSDRLLSDAGNTINNFNFTRMTERGGKVRGLNYVVPHLKTAIVAITDANTIYEEDALMEMVKYFKDDSVGYVSGNLVYKQDTHETAAEGESLYWKYETLLKTIEDKGPGILMGAGAVMAFRTELFENVPPETADDSYLPLLIRLKGYRNVFASNSIAYEPVGKTISEEFRRRVRMVGQDTRVFFYIMNHKLKGSALFIFQLISHKFLKWNVMHFMGLLLLSNTLLVLQGRMIVVMMLQLIFYGMSFGGFLLEKNSKEVPRALKLPTYWCVSHIAAGIGFWCGIIGKSQSTWTSAPSTRK